MKQHIGGDVVVSYWGEVHVWGAANWANTPIKQFNNLCKGSSIEFLDGDLLLKGGNDGQLEFIDYAQTASQLPPTIQLHSICINPIQRIAKNIVASASYDGYLKVIDPISRKYYLKFKVRGDLLALTYFY